MLWLSLQHKDDLKLTSLGMWNEMKTSPRLLVLYRFACFLFSSSLGLDSKFNSILTVVERYFILLRSLTATYAFHFSLSLWLE